MKRFAIVIMASVVALVLSPALLWCAVLYHNHGSLGLRCGLLANANEPYLDGSSKLLQSCSWHIGNGTRTRGETYGLKVRRLYVSLGVRHTNQRISPEEAEE